MSVIKNKKIGIIAAMENEFSLLLNNLTDKNSIKVFDCNFYTGKINNSNVVIVKSGMGKVNAALAATVLIDHFGCNLIINSGIAGGIYPSKTKDVILSSSLVYSDVDARNFGYKYGQVPGMPEEFLVKEEIIDEFKQILNNLNIEYKVGVIATSDKFALSKDIIKDNDEKIIAVDMESAAIAQVSYKASVDFIVLRFISDLVGEESQIDNYDKFEEEMANESAMITLKFFEGLK